LDLVTDLCIDLAQDAGPLGVRERGLGYEPEGDLAWSILVVLELLDVIEDVTVGVEPCDGNQVAVARDDLLLKPSATDGAQQRELAPARAFSRSVFGKILGSIADERHCPVRKAGPHDFADLAFLLYRQTLLIEQLDDTILKEHVITFSPIALSRDASLFAVPELVEQGNAESGFNPHTLLGKEVLRGRQE